MKTRAPRRRPVYGARVGHAVAMAVTFAIAGLAVAGWLQGRLSTAGAILVWFLGAIVLHDLVFLPVYSLLDRLVLGSGRRRIPGPPGPPGPHTGAPRVRPYIRVPAIICALLLLVFSPEILRLGDGAFHTASGLHQDVYLPRYLVACAVLFGASAVAYGIAVIRHRAAARPRTRPRPRRSPPAR